MNEQQLAAVKQALEALELHGNQYPHMVKGYCLDAITALKAIISQDALDKMAENARELGLDYEPAPVQEPWPQCTHNWVSNPKEKWCLRCGAQEADHIAGGGKVMPTAAQPAVQEGRDWSLLEATQESLREHMAEIKRLKAAQPVPVKTYHDGKPWPVQPKPWVGLTDKEVGAAYDFANANSQYGHHHFGFWLDSYRAIETKLKEKNHDQ
jgi:hypothetical protein